MESEAKKKVKYVEAESVTPKVSEGLEKSDLGYFLKNERMIEVLKKKGVKSFFPVQYETFKQLYDGQDLIARDRTGSGKTIAFSLPILERFRNERVFESDTRPKFLIVLPTRYLMD